MNPAKRSESARITPDKKIEEQIRQRAYGLYEARGSENGHALDDWLQAETEILGMEQEAAA